MKKIILLTLLMSFCSLTKAQNDTVAVKKYSIISPIVNYDMNGNAYYLKKELDHIPTHEDSISFEYEGHSSMKEIMDSVEREAFRYTKYIDSVNKIKYRKKKNYAPIFPREGKHLFSLHWISESKFGAVVIKKINQQKYSVKGNQRDDYWSKGLSYDLF